MSLDLFGQERFEVTRGEQSRFDFTDDLEAAIDAATRAFEQENETTGQAAIMPPADAMTTETTNARIGR